MEEYITEELQDFREDVSQVVTSPAARWLLALGKFR